MPPESPSQPDRPSKAEELFTQWLARSGADENAALDELCRTHPAHAAELRELERGWKRLQSLLKRAGLSAQRSPLADELRSRFGDVDPGVSLGGERPAPDTNASSELLKRLRAHAPSSSRYQLLGEVGRGGMGAVLKIWDEDLRRTLAMKVVLGKDESSTSGNTPPVDAKTLGRFLEEAQVTG
ncbi:MAG: hypothetical protein HZA53_02915 [Planctomycetes bacterium]|nr:hypothetical protein [Planctomycetota bacterium]